MRDCTGPEMVEWAAYFDVEPPDEAADWRTALVCSTMARLKGQRVKARDFMPRRKPQRQDAGEQIAMFRALTG